MESRKRIQSNAIILAGLAAIVLCGLSFWSGTAYQKSHDKSSGSQSFARSGQFGGPGNGNFRQGGDIGSVTAVSDTSITVKNQRTAESKTYTINSSTTVTNNGSEAAASDIKTGDTVIVEPDSANSSTASRIMLNPSFRGGPGDAQSSTSDDSGLQTN